MSKHACPGDGYESVLCDVRLVAVSRISKLSAKPAWLSTQTLDADTSSGWDPFSLSSDRATDSPAAARRATAATAAISRARGRGPLPRLGVRSQRVQRALVLARLP